MTRATAPPAHLPSTQRDRLLRGLPVLAAATRARGDGVSYVALLVERALAELYGVDPNVVEYSRPGHDKRSFNDRVTFMRDLLNASTRGQVWIMYNHVGLARGHRIVNALVRTPYVIFLHGIEVWDKPLDRPRVAALAGATLRIANSNVTAARTEQRFPGIGPVHPCLLALLPDCPPWPCAGDMGLSAVVDGTFALIVGRMHSAERYKGHDELLEAWPTVRERLPTARLVVAGDGDDRPRLEAKATQLGLDGAFVFTGRVSDATLDVLYQRAALFAMPSRGEGFGLVYLQAMRACLPCIGSVDDAARDVILEGRTGLLVSQTDRAALASALVRLLSDEAMRRRFGAAGRERYEREFTFPHFRERLRGVLRDATPAGVL